MMQRRIFLKTAGIALAGSWMVPGRRTSDALAQTRETVNDDLIIDSVEPFLLDMGRNRPLPHVRITTRSGIHGWGEGTSPPTGPAIATQIRESGMLLIGQSAWNIERIWNQLYVEEFNTLGGTLFGAMSAIDIALYDIVGKAAGLPVYRLLGGKVYDELRLYASYRWGNIEPTTAAYEARTRELIAEGVTAGKFDPFFQQDPPSRQLRSGTLNQVRDIISGIRAAGPDFDICVEAHGRFNTGSAGRVIRMLEPFDPFFLEEPVGPEYVDAMAALQRSTNIPIATGEGLQSHYAYTRLLSEQAARIIQPDVSRVGGITAMKKIAAMADAHFVTVAPHNPNGPVCCAANMHVAASIPNFLIFEEGSPRHDLYRDVFQDGWTPRNDAYSVPESPGLGIDLSDAFLRSHAAPLR